MKSFPIPPGGAASCQVNVTNTAFIRDNARTNDTWKLVLPSGMLCTWVATVLTGTVKARFDSKTCAKFDSRALSNLAWEQKTVSCLST